ncbi:hypothetical protein GCM10025883_11990 [Mobilicoccus caccae]|uniref:Peptidase M10 metallopeptidase domain-containing protein n=1 Tax=Mobilicoccus caccae TaxID=1859295 RepID=A0ABQ6INX0_9MICO|nr:hypothetical protein GCM10025883_11990 [Mobilicoccus caccae]
MESDRNQGVSGLERCHARAPTQGRQPCPRTYGVFVTTWQERNGRAITANITLDTANISSGPLPGLWSHKIQGVYAHELGHGLNLKDNPNTGRVSLMKYGSQGLQGGYYWPQPYDIEDVRRIFP